MFGISFGEMLVIGLICLVVVGPKKLPTMARYCGHMLGKLNRQIASVKRDISHEMDLEDLREAKEIATKAATEVKEDISSFTNIDLASAVDSEELSSKKPETSNSKKANDS